MFFEKGITYCPFQVELHDSNRPKSELEFLNRSKFCKRGFNKKPRKPKYETDMITANLMSGKTDHKTFENPT